MASICSCETAKRLNGSGDSRATFVKRAASIKSNAGGWQLVADMAEDLVSVHDKLDIIIELLKGKIT